MSIANKNRVRKPRVCDLSDNYICADCGIEYKGRGNGRKAKNNFWEPSL